jgi:excisionase family DNA binding protein
MQTDSDLLTAEEAAPMLRVSTESVRRYIREGHIKAVKIGRRYMIAPSEIERIKAEGTAPVILAGGREFHSPEGGIS